MKEREDQQVTVSQASLAPSAVSDGCHGAGRAAEQRAFFLRQSGHYVQQSERCMDSSDQAPQLSGCDGALGLRQRTRPARLTAAQPAAGFFFFFFFLVNR